MMKTYLSITTSEDVEEDGIIKLVFIAVFLARKGLFTRHALERKLVSFMLY
jgi:hypothetical protein